MTDTTATVRSLNDSFRKRLVFGAQSFSRPASPVCRKTVWQICWTSSARSTGSRPTTTRTASMISAH
ncbi:hypothetical protein AB7M56_007010 [Bradyrhizobium elkanii]|nr:hypothetical protein [Bradyrhizobium elkanii]MCS4067841.1 hypothetical protein [Bradyrhizobium elkanii]MCS4083377.1 hypothetical protein [Bradyrhizobium elkanii]MCW2126996.1 hypothetical protein [Bradyrhizobium elkanii]MCW2173743.1 hypothetical protein [Bradyrhizobium elkanii]